MECRAPDVRWPLRLAERPPVDREVPPPVVLDPPCLACFIPEPNSEPLAPDSGGAPLAVESGSAYSLAAGLDGLTWTPLGEDPPAAYAGDCNVNVEHPTVVASSRRIVRGLMSSSPGCHPAWSCKQHALSASSSQLLA